MVGFNFLVADGPDLGRTFSLLPGITIIGRLDASLPDDPRGSVRWTLTDPAVSRTHAQITWDGYDPPVLVHLSTTNATLLNGRIVTGQSLEQGQSLAQGHLLRLGQSTLEVQAAVAATADAATDTAGVSAEAAIAPPNWRVQEGADQLSLDTLEWEAQGIHWTVRGSEAEVKILSDEEAYLLRRISGTLWSTPLKKDVPVTVCGGDILRLNQRRLEILRGEG